MLRFKRIDIIVQVLLIISALVYGIGFNRDLNFIAGYFFVGVWQLLSCFTHMFFANKSPVSPDRRKYWNIVRIIVSVGLLLSLLSFYITNRIDDMTFGYFCTALVVTPFIAVWYLTICISEVKKIKEQLRLKSLINENL